MNPHAVPRLFSHAADFPRNVHWLDSGSAPAVGCQCRPESEVSHSSCSSGCSGHGSPSSLTSYRGVMQRSISSHSLQRSGAHQPVSASLADLLEEAQRMNVMQESRRSESPLSSESSMIIEGMSRAYPYSPEEKKVRIERYRIKKNKRNFNKKIKYVCRKTLADSRPRIRGRFARSEEVEKKREMIENNESGEEEDENWTTFLETLVVANLVQEP
ncbi:two-component response regulator-like APRR9 isoform X2 [Prosopis cineraria]|uniref:two-component response regulator-like APRR9 isoform X2 n=1 Tax=Prosopis cineraria TaxID=364024 RepID=UPI00240FF8F7|nr:two-component response regulator-like APRR9 isoform X2 [Prosopis cineraria]